MAQSIRNIVTEVNNALAAVFNGAKFYGVAISVEREGKVKPQVNELPVSFDDSYAMQVYHKINGVQITYRPGFGDTNNTINTFALSAFVFNNEKRTHLKSDEIAMIMQSVLSGLNILSVRILPSSIVLNSAAIFSTEYRGNDYRLGGYTSLMQFNYNLEVTFKSGCFDLCPEDFSQCKIN
jgi:hypothetical protein